jgi:hypothetical protein
MRCRLPNSWTRGLRPARHFGETFDWTKWRDRTRGLVILAVLFRGAPGLVSAHLTLETDQIIDSAGAPGSIVGLDYSFGIAVDANDNAYVSGYNSHNVFKITPGGTITEIIDATGAGLGAPLTGPSRLATDSAGNVYVIGEDSDNAFKIEPDGSTTELIDMLGDGQGNLLDGPKGIAVDSAGNVFVSSWNNAQVFRIEPDGSIDLVVDGSGAGPGMTLSRPTVLAADAADNIYVVGSNNVLRIDPSLTVTELISPAGDGLGTALNSPSSLAMAPNGDIYIGGYTLFVVHTNGSIEHLPVDSPWMSGLAIDSAGILYAQASTEVTEYAPDGTDLGPILSELGDFRGNVLYGAFDVAVDSEDRVYTAGRWTNNAFRAQHVPVPEAGFGISVCLTAAVLLGLGRRRV